LKSRKVEDKEPFNISNRRYIGGKSLLVDQIFEQIPKKYSSGTFFDVFSGTGVVADAALDRFKKIIVNDLLFSNQIIYDAFFGKGKYSQRKINKFTEWVNSNNPDLNSSNYFSRNFGGKFFSQKSARRIGNIRELIEEESFTGRERSILIASLLYSTDRIANTVGHYEAYRKKETNFKDFEYRLIKPYKDVSVDIYRQDSNELVRRVKSDVAYIDPPYNSRQYSRFYHVLENLAKWEKPKLEGVALKPPLENLSEYCTVRAPEAFSDLIENLEAKLIIVSYNNTYESRSSSSKNKITLNQINYILSKKGKTKTKRIKHKFFNTGKTEFLDHKEFLFITETA
jgi:adenine-specific DNA-methyltransferase